MDFCWCLFRLVTGVGCPGCGLTRSILALLQGDVVQSILLHPMGVVVAVWVLNLWWWRSFCLSFWSRKIISHAVLAGFLVPWVFKLVI